MCGFVGLLSSDRPPDSDWLENAADTIRHRGPDDAGTYLDYDAGFGMAHRRLSILDLSSRGRQPMVSQSGRYVIAYNGEIYNHLEIRTDLMRRSNRRFETSNDTETVLAAIENWGVKKAIGYFNGMFAFALWDVLNKRLCLVRDRMGEKPLYIGWVSQSIVFSSELKPILSAFSVELEPKAIPLQVSLGYIPAPWSVIQGVFKLPPAHFIWLSSEDARFPKDSAEFQSSIECYWSLPEVVRSGAKQRSIAMRESDLVDRLDQLLGDSVKQRMLSDVPLGACLSGGIDSSIIVALMQKYSEQPIKTYTVGFHETRYDESRFASKIAMHLGCDHTDIILEENEALSWIPELPKVYDEPFADSSQLPTLLVSKMLRKHVKVALSGDGGDELFCGYPRYFLAPRLWQLCGWLSLGLRRWTARQSNRKFAEYYRIWRLSQRLSASDFDSFYLALSSICPDYSILFPGFSPVSEILPKISRNAINRGEQMMFRDQALYLPDDILVKVDRASMAMGLEMRAPFLDHRVVERAWCISIDMKLRKGRGKWILRQLLKRYLPEALFERPKQGFGIPIDHWLRGALRDWAEHLFSKQSVDRCPGLDYRVVRKLWCSHQADTVNAGYLLWNLLILLAWIEEWRV